MGEQNIPVERESNIARVNRPKYEAQIHRQCPGKEGPHATFSVEKVFNTATSSDGRDSGNGTSDETAYEDTGDV